MYGPIPRSSTALQVTYEINVCELQRSIDAENQWTMLTALSAARISDITTI
jgi:hypothetical protein